MDLLDGGFSSGTNRYKSALTGKTAQAILWCLVLCAIAGFREDPRALLQRFAFMPIQGVSLISTSPAVAEQVIPEMPSQAAAVPSALDNGARLLGINLRSPDLTGKVHQIEDPSGLAMRVFYEALYKTFKREPGAITRIMHLGDSLVVVDFLTGEIRRRFQDRFGDSGHGYMLVGKPWTWYQHWDIAFHPSPSWNIDGIMKAPQPDYFGLGGYSFDGSRPEHFTEFGTSNKGPVGRTADRFEAHYLIQPNGGSFEVLVDGVMNSRISTKGPKFKSGVHVVRVPDGPHTFRVQCVGDGHVRLFGGVMERETPGVVYDTLGVNGCRVRTWELVLPEFWAEQLRLRKPNLVVLNFGTNESEDEGRPMLQVEADYLSVLQRLRAAVPDASCMVMSSLDRAARINGALATKPIIPLLVATQRRAAQKAGCAFYDSYEAMGGRGSMARWYTGKPRLCSGDMTHPTRAGADIVGDGLYRALIVGFLEYEGRNLMPGHQLPMIAPLEYMPLWPFQPDPYPPLPEMPPRPY